MPKHVRMPSDSTITLRINAVEMGEIDKALRQQICPGSGHDQNVAVQLALSTWFSSHGALAANNSSIIISAS